MPCHIHFFKKSIIGFYYTIKTKSDNQFRKMIRRIAYALSAIIIFAVFLSYANIVFKVDDDYAESVMQTLYREQDDTIDAFYIGNSGVYRYWQTPIAWDSTGVAILDISTSGMPGSAVQYVAEEAMKKQNPSLLIFDVRSFCMSEEETRDNTLGIHVITDNMRWSLNKFRMIWSEINTIEINSSIDVLEYYLPLLRFHSKQLTASDWTLRMNKVKNGLLDEHFFNSVVGEDVIPVFDNKRRELAQTNKEDLIQLLEWATAQEQNGTRILFVASPLLSHSEQLERINAAGDLVENYGFPFINYSTPTRFNKFGFDVSKDFQRDLKHTNIFGSKKYTIWFARYLQKTYDLKDHRGEDAYKSWDYAADKYSEVIGNP